MTLAEVGIRLSDVFGVDSILWVEGKTEEMCFPELITTLGGRTLHGVQVLGVVSTDELAAKQARRVFDIYARLSEGASLLPPATAFVLDPEDRSLSKMKEMQRLSNDKLHWFPRRMYENYLLEPDAITHVLNEVDRGRIDAVTEEDVLHWIRQHGEEERYFEKNSVVAYETADWAVIVKGATVLRDIFSEFTEQRVTYDKVRHGAMLTKYLVRHPTEAIKELAEWLTGLLP
ncbi:hypothetical protein GCM10010872_15910 [Dyella flava]|nr:hypothetical protein GCM10010872_15910 [Dyella flava]